MKLQRFAIASPLHNISYLHLSLSTITCFQWEDHLVVTNQTSRGASGLPRRTQKYLHMYPTMGLEIGPWFPGKQVLMILSFPHATYVVLFYIYIYILSFVRCT
jgi:hypothetical protein